MGIALTRQEEEAVKNLLLDMATAIPPLNVVAGIRDITSTGWDLYRQNYKTPEEENELKLQLILGIVCLIPGAGAPVRTTFRQLTRNPDFYGPLMFEIITRIIEQANVLMVRNNFRPIPVNPEAFLMQLIDIGRLERELENARKAALASAKDSVFGRWFDVSGTINACFDFVKRNLSSCLILLSRYIRNTCTTPKIWWIGLGSRNSNVNRNKTATVISPCCSMQARPPRFQADTVPTTSSGTKSKSIRESFCLQGKSARRGMRTVILFFGRIPFGDCLNAKTKAKSVSAKKRWKSFKNKRGIMKGRLKLN